MANPAPSASPRNALIIGAGVAGLAAALRLGELGWRARVLERDAEPGGLARSLHFKGVSTDLGPHRIYTEIPRIQRLLEQVAAKAMYTVQRRSHIYLRGSFLPYPPSPVAMTLNLGPWRMAKFGGSYALNKLRPAQGEETFESIMRGAFGPALYEFLLRPYIAKTWKTDPAELHADTARVRVSAGSLAKMMRGLLTRGREANPTAVREFRYIKGGAETLVRLLREQAEAKGACLETGRELRAFELDEDMKVVAADAGGATANSLSSDFFLSTVPLPHLMGCLPDRAELAAARSAATGLNYLNILFVVLIIRRKVITGDNWLYFPEPHLTFNRAYEAKSMDAGMVPQDRSVMCFEATLRPEDPRWREADQAWIEEVAGQAAGTGLFRRDEVEEALVYRLPFAYPIYSLDYDRRLEGVWAGLSKISNLITLGRQGLFNHNNMDHSMFMGLEGADLVAADPETAAAKWYGEAARFKKMRIVD